MAYYFQNEPNLWPRNGTAPVKDYYPMTATYYGPAGLPQSETNPGTTQPSSGFQASPQNYTITHPTFGQHDGLGGALMRVSQADLYRSDAPPSLGRFPRAGTWEEPGAAVAALQLVRLAPTTSAHPGLAQATGAGPSMVFFAPPVFTAQSKPIWALGL